MEFHYVSTTQVEAGSAEAKDIAAVVQAQLRTLNRAFAGYTDSVAEQTIDTKLRFVPAGCERAECQHNATLQVRAS